MSRHASLNRAYALVWNDGQQAYVPAPETTPWRKTQGDCARHSHRCGVYLFLRGRRSGAEANAFTTGQVSAGQASITQTAGQMQIQQTTDQAAIDWQSFNMGSNAQVTFAQPSANSIALNRVLGQEASQIYGHLRANGQVFLLNANGVMFAPSANVDVGGLLASTRNLKNEDFLADRLTLSGDGNGQMVNQGDISALHGGYVALVGAR